MGSMLVCDCGTHLETIIKTEGSPTKGLFQFVVFLIFLVIYVRSDVILMCFDIGRIDTLHHCRYYSNITAGF